LIKQKETKLEIKSFFNNLVSKVFSFHITDRHAFLDVLRGFTVFIMIIFHLCFDLTQFRYLKIDFGEDPFWYWYPRFIVFNFLICVGIGTALVHKKKIIWPKVIKRFKKIFSLALLISLVTYFAFPKSWIYFGTLHCIAFTSIAALPFLKFPKLSLGIGLVMIASVFFLNGPLIPIGKWLGVKSMDYIPFYPWFGVVLIGIFMESVNLHKIKMPNNSLVRFLSFQGQNALFFYIIHQPVLYGSVACFYFLTK
jgi:uncharacterized membrane protein